MGSMGMNNNMNSMGLGGNAFGNQQQQNATHLPTWAAWEAAISNALHTAVE